MGQLYFHVFVYVYTQCVCTYTFTYVLLSAVFLTWNICIFFLIFFYAVSLSSFHCHHRLSSCHHLFISFSFIFFVLNVLEGLCVSDMWLHMRQFLPLFYVKSQYFVYTGVQRESIYLFLYLCHVHIALILSHTSHWLLLSVLPCDLK